jgi:hypothetical protein
LLEFFLLFNIVVRYRRSIKNGATLIALIFHIIIVRISGFDGDISVYMEGFNQDRSEFYYLKEILFWLIIDFYNYFVEDDYVFLAIDLTVLLLIYKICKKMRLKFYYAPMFYVTFFNILGHQNIYRQWLAGLIFIYLYINRGKYTFFVGLIHNSLLAFVGANSIKSSKHRILMLLFLPLFGYLISNYLPSGYQEVETGSNFVLPLNILMICNFLILKWLCQDEMVLKLFLNTTFFVITVSLFLSSTFGERMVYLYLCLIMPFTLFELNKKSKILTFAYSLILIVPSYFTSVILFMN